MSQIRDIFVSHSHHDRNAVAALVARLSPEFDIYVDLNDPMLVDAPSKRLAKRLLNEIQHCRVLLFVLSVKAIRSRWMPWELGLAHGRVGRILLWPLTPAALRALEKQQYLHLYDVVDASDPDKTLRAVVKQARRELISDAMAEMARLAGAYAQELPKHVAPAELPGATAGASRAVSVQYTLGAIEVRGNKRKR